MTNEDSSRPLITFALFAYNQEKYIREAVEGALAQTYSPLEIILSDDCSSDRTFEIMQEMTSNYHGVHSVVLNRNADNLGISQHVNVIFSMASGALIIAAAGDDISTEDRTVSLFEVWARFGYPSAVASSLIEIDEESNPIYMNRSKEADYESDFLHSGTDRIREYLNQRFPIPFIGAVFAYKNSLIKTFPKLNPSLPLEDHIYFFRAMLVDGVAVSKKKLVKYRRSLSSVGNPLGLNKAMDGVTKKKRVLDIQNQIRSNRKKNYEKQIISQQIFDYKMNNSDLGLSKECLSKSCRSMKSIALDVLYIIFPSFLLARLIFWYRQNKYD